ncbi:MAG: UpxY family transcription antiterminator [Desulfobacteraceae bacterium]|nr:MAG: UpxY family transcription antiterminator [Desulfobacteraceae bacterium]
MSHDEHWYALLTRSNFEYTVFNSIMSKQVEAFLPKTRKQSRRKDRKLMIDMPLFPGYLFVKTSLEPAKQLHILKTTGAVRLLGSQSGPVPVPESQINSLKILTSASMDLITGSIITLKKGDPVMILSGPMAGVTGEFVRHKGKGRVLIRIDVLGQYAGVEVEEDNLEKVPDLLS